MDIRVREAEQLLASGDPDLLPDAVALLRRYDAVTVGVALTALHPFVRKNRGCRGIFLELLPTDAAAFCRRCGDMFELAPCGFPAGKRGPRKKRSYCDACEKGLHAAIMASARVGGDHRRTMRDYYSQNNYCWRCGYSVANALGEDGEWNHDCPRSRAKPAQPAEAGSSEAPVA